LFHKVFGGVFDAEEGPFVVAGLATRGRRLMVYSTSPSCLRSANAPRRGVRLIPERAETSRSEIATLGTVFPIE
jgi:hypothetical protein